MTHHSETLILHSLPQIHHTDLATIRMHVQNTGMQGLDGPWCHQIHQECEMHLGSWGDHWQSIHHGATNYH